MRAGFVLESSWKLSKFNIFHFEHQFQFVLNISEISIWLLQRRSIVMVFTKATKRHEKFIYLSERENWFIGIMIVIQPALRVKVFTEMLEVVNN